MCPKSLVKTRQTQHFPVRSPSLRQADTAIHFPQLKSKKQTNKQTQNRSTLKSIQFSLTFIFDLIQFRRKCFSRGHLAKSLGSGKDLIYSFTFHFGKWLMYFCYLCQFVAVVVVLTLGQHTEYEFPLLFFLMFVKGQLL